MARARLAFLLALALLSLLLMACNDWDGMDRSDWQPTPTMGPTWTPEPYRDSRRPGRE